MVKRIVASTRRKEYTENERELLDILLSQKGLMISSNDIVRLHYARRRRPVNANRSVTTVLNTLILKTRKNQEPYRVRKSRRDGRNSIVWWSE
jgi:hypothetical protein